MYICHQFFRFMKKNLQFKLFVIKSMLKFSSFFSTKWCAFISFRIFTTPFRKGSSFRPAIFEKAEQLNIPVDGININGYRWNIESNKRILIAHGFESRSFNFYRYIENLVEKGIGVYAMDAKAHGDSEGKTITLPEYVSMFKEIEKKYGVFDGYICHSFGGIAVSLYEEEFNHPSSKLVLIAPATETATAIGMFCKYFGLSNKVKFAIYDFIEKRGGKKIEHYSINRITRKITNSILWIHDRDDDITPIMDVEDLMNEKPPNVDFLITSGLGHRKIYKDPEIIKKVVEFLEF